MKLSRSLTLGAVVAASILVSSCASTYDSYSNGGRSYWWYDNSSYGSGYNNANHGDNARYRGGPPVYRPVRVKPGYHFTSSDGNTPVSHKRRDSNWIQQQNPQAYTIEVGRGQGAAQVAKALYQAPKTERSAQMKYQSGDGQKSTGVYGTYNSREEAEAALSKLPSGVRGQAKVSKWKEVQTLTPSSSSNSSRPAPAGSM